LVCLDPPVIGGAEKLAGERADHAKFLFLRFGIAAVKGRPGCLSTHRDASRHRPRSGEHPPNEWEFSNPRFNGQKREKMRALAIDLDLAEIWPGQSLVNAPTCQGFHHFDRLFTLPS
jgi:hypothetical protein